MMAYVSITVMVALTVTAKWNMWEKGVNNKLVNIHNSYLRLFINYGGL